ncbi:hypothetical protein C0Q70_05467 [Pomacea canaliculata]|uniref:Uncharacterized protein n=1 Tax=Pomacea canaliculata TaxID=400727 RepID=A0A2T7PL95_POMCA|nr:hypothetical protein C0Q70_05467 [Pomacea canaliculata]
MSSRLEATPMLPARPHVPDVSAGGTAGVSHDDHRTCELVQEAASVHRVQPFSHTTIVRLPPANSTTDHLVMTSPQLQEDSIRASRVFTNAMSEDTCDTIVPRSFRKHKGQKVATTAGVKTDVAVQLYQGSDTSVQHCSSSSLYPPQTVNSKATKHKVSVWNLAVREQPPEVPRCASPLPPREAQQLVPGAGPSPCPPSLRSAVPAKDSKKGKPDYRRPPPSRAMIRRGAR